MKSIQKKILPAILVLLISTIIAGGQQIPYGTGHWDPQGLGNHRAVIYVESYADAVKVTVPWRRLDDVNGKNLILMDGLTNQRVLNLVCTHKDKEYGEIVFQPVSGEGYYYLYFMPGRVSGRWWHPDAEYLKPEDTFDAKWKEQYGNKADPGLARTVAFESKSPYHSFWPMEVPVTAKEMSEILARNPDNEFLIFPESRNFPIRMTETIPQRWYLKDADNTFEGYALRNEAYSWQIGIFACYNELRNVNLVFSDLKTAGGDVLPASSLKCINMGGNDHLGSSFVKAVSVPKGEVRSMWIVTDIGSDQSPGTYRGEVAVAAEGTRNYTVNVTLHIRDEVAVNRGYNTPQNQSRLNWLDSGMGIDDEVVAPYIPVKVNGRTVSVLGRKLTFNTQGFPEKITSSFTGSNHSTDGPEKDILSGPMRMTLFRNGKEIPLSTGRARISDQTSGSAAWQTILNSPDIMVSVNARMECDGYVNYETRITAKRDVMLDDMQLVIPFKKSTAKYLMGMGKQGGYTPEKLEWVWNQEFANNMIWLGDVNAGLQLKLKHLVPDWKLGSFEQVGPYRDWSNEGKGGCRVISSDNEVTLTAYTGSKSMKPGDEMVLNFGLLVTPLKTLDDSHWNEKYYHTDNNPETAAKIGATIMNIHHANDYNPYINYPFLSDDALKAVVDKGRKLNIRTKLYYTVRELTTFLPELWALRHLDDEIFTRTNVTFLADTHEEKDPNSIYGMTGHPWLLEHLRTNYDPAWHDPKVAADGDMSIRTQGLSRWHNYYIEGLNFMIKEFGTRGLYLDGVGYDREIMKRIRKTMDRAADSCLIDFHSGNAFEPAYGLNSPANNYMELFPYVNSLWLGEGYDYNSAPDYWLVEISGIPFGLYGEMLQNCGNAYRGMVYGMSTRFYGGCRPMNIWKLWDYFGMEGSEYIGYWDGNNPVKTGNQQVLAGVYRKPDKILVALGNWTSADQVASLSIDWQKLGFDPEKATIEIPPIDDLQEAGITGPERLSIPASKGLILIIHR
jgi:hypothetical protein